MMVTRRRRRRGNDNDDDYHNDQADDEDNNGSDDRDYDGSSNNYGAVLQEIRNSSEEGDDDEEEGANDGIEHKFCSRVGRHVTTLRSRRFFGVFDLSGKPMLRTYLPIFRVLVEGEGGPLSFSVLLCHSRGGPPHFCVITPGLVTGNRSLKNHFS